MEDPAGYGGAGGDPIGQAMTCTPGPARRARARARSQRGGADADDAGVRVRDRDQDRGGRGAASAGEGRTVIARCRRCRRAVDVEAPASRRVRTGRATTRCAVAPVRAAARAPCRRAAPKRRIARGRSRRGRRRRPCRFRCGTVGMSRTRPQLDPAGVEAQAVQIGGEGGHARRARGRRRATRVARHAARLRGSAARPRSRRVQARGRADRRPGAPGARSCCEPKPARDTNRSRPPAPGRPLP